MPTDRTRVDPQPSEPIPERLVFGRDLRCKKCKGKGAVFDGGKEHICYRCSGRGVIQNPGYKDEGP